MCVIDIANFMSTGSSIFPAIECMVGTNCIGNHFIDRLFGERKVHKNAPPIFNTSGLIRRWSDWRSGLIIGRLSGLITAWSD